MKLPAFRLERYFAEYEFTTEYLLCGSDCESMSIGDLLALEDGALEKFGNLWLGYTESQGGPTLRKEISKIYKSIPPEAVLVHTGAQEAIFLFMHAMLTDGDHIIVHTPSYQSLSEVAKSIGCSIGLWRAREANGWSLELDDLPKLLRPNTRAIVINTPHNPTGYLMSRVDFASVNEFAQEHGLLLFSDEVYREAEYDPATRLPAACDLGDHAVSLGVISKTYGLAGLRIGWVATNNRKVYDSIAKLKDYTTICNSAPSEFLAAVGIRNRSKLAERNLRIIENNLTIVDDVFAHYPETFSWVRPTAGPIGFPRYLAGDVESFCDRLVREAGVLLLPGSVYDDIDNHFRLGLGRKNLPQAVERLVEYL